MKNTSKSSKPAILCLEAQKKQVSFNKLAFEQASLPPELYLAYSIQYKPLALEVKKFLESKKILVKGFTQVLGCSDIKTNLPILLVGSGKFHALNLALSNKEVYIYNSTMNQIETIQESELQAIKAKNQAKISKFLILDEIGLLVSTKPGQKQLARALLLKSKIEKAYPTKKIFLFISNNFNLSELENFNIQLFINSACRGLANDSSAIISSEEIEKLL